MSRSTPTFLLLAGWLFSSVAWADTDFITDRIVANMYAKPDEQSMVVDRLPTGTPVEVLETKEYFTRVRTPGGAEGWVPHPLLRDDEPAQVALLRLAEQHRQTEAELERLEEQKRGIPSWLTLALAALAGLLGFILGASWMDWRIRVRHGGFRI